MNLRVGDIEPRITVDKISPLLSLNDVIEEKQKNSDYRNNTASASQNTPHPELQNKARLALQQATTLKGTALPSATPAAFDSRIFKIDQVYAATVEKQLSAQTAIVSMNGTFVPVKIGNQWNVGETLQLKYLGSLPSPSFMLMPTTATPNIDVANISASGSLIQHYLNSAQPQTSATHVESAYPITTSPANSVTQIAHDLKEALAKTGLFYESHLVAHLNGQYSKNDLLREPQNAMPHTQDHIIGQQLNLIERPHLSWHGEVWPQQPIVWEIHVQATVPSPFHTSLPVDDDAPPATSNEEHAVISSKISLELPNLGHITAETQVKNGKLYLRVLADSDASTQRLKAAQATLLTQMKTSGLSIERLAIGHQHVNAISTTASHRLSV